ncbi:MAG: methyltransferase domain-containing protein [Chloroflexi bacterium]|nr:methyltransferase domain-containing protein [Chloroflexota bacterium]
MSQSEENYAHLLDGLSIDTSGPWQEWDWGQVGPWTSYDCARLEEYRDSVIVAYRLYNRIGLEHLRRMLDDAPHDARLLDAGGGTGRKAIPLAQDGFTDITLLDYAPEWLRLADEKAQEANVRDKLKLINGDVCDMCDFPDDSFDHVFALGGVVSYCGNPAAAIREMTRVLAPGGGLLADGIHSRFATMRYAARVGNLKALEELTWPSGAPARIPIVLPEELETFALQAGLIDVRVWSEFIFEMDNEIRLGPNTEQWEKVILELEMRHYDDPRFLGSAPLMLYATKEQNPPTTL